MSNVSPHELSERLQAAARAWLEVDRNLDAGTMVDVSISLGCRAHHEDRMMLWPIGWHTWYEQCNDVSESGVRFTSQQVAYAWVSAGGSMLGFGSITPARPFAVGPLSWWVESNRPEATLLPALVEELNACAVERHVRELTARRERKLATQRLIENLNRSPLDVRER